MTQPFLSCCHVFFVVRFSSWRSVRARTEIKGTVPSRLLLEFEMYACFRLVKCPRIWEHPGQSGRNSGTSVERKVSITDFSSRLHGTERNRGGTRSMNAQPFPSFPPPEPLRVTRFFHIDEYENASFVFPDDAFGYAKRKRVSDVEKSERSPVASWKVQTVFES